MSQEALEKIEQKIAALNFQESATRLNVILNKVNQTLIDHILPKVEAKKFLNIKLHNIEFPLTISEPVKIHRVGHEYDLRYLVLEFLNTKKFIIITHEIMISDEDYEFQGYAIKEQFEQTYTGFYSETNEPFIAYRDTGAFMNLACITQEMRDEYSAAMKAFNELISELKKLREWKEKVECTIKLEKKLEE
jgi:hypothetical protein